jgi:hypothetical protein
MGNVASGRRMAEGRGRRLGLLRICQTRSMVTTDIGLVVMRKGRERREDLTYSSTGSEEMPLENA